MRLKLALFTLGFIATFLAACQKQLTTPTPIPVTEPFITGLIAPEFDQTTSDAVRRQMGQYLKVNTFTEYEAGSQLLLYLVSSGEFDQAKITLGSEETYHADVLYAYTLMSNQRVLVVPVVIGLTLSDGQYAYFSENVTTETETGETTRLDRETALTDANVRLPRGRIFRLLAYSMVNRQGLDWQQCSSLSFYPPEICPIGELVEQLFPNQTKTFVLRLSDEFSPGWLLIGWFFQEFAPEEMSPGTPIDVLLPTLTPKP